MRFGKEKRRRELRDRPFSPEWERVLREHVPFYTRLPEDDRAELHGKIHVFLDEKQFEGCGGLVVTDAIRVTIAAHACLLLLHRDTDYYPELSSILVYPSTYVAPVEEWEEGGIVSEFEEERAGETWGHGSLVLSWDGVKGEAGVAPSTADGEDGRHRPGNGGPHPHDAEAMDISKRVSGATPHQDIVAPEDDDSEIVPAFNVALHEFAHQLDLENGAIDGTPKLDSTEQYRSWHDVLAASFEQLESEWTEGADPVIDEYALEDDSEFFAVATESFFETPFAVLEEYPALYEALRGYYHQDPASWGEAPSSR